MANVKITQLPSATTPLTGTEVFPLVQGTTTKQVAITGLFTSPVMTNPTLGTVGQADLINATGLPISTGVAGLGTGIATFLGTPSSSNLRAAVTDETGTGSLVFATSPTLVTPNLGTPTFLVATNATGTALGLIAGSAITNANLTGAVTSVGNATSLGSFTSAQLRTALTDETGSGVAVFATSPTLVTPVLGTPQSGDFSTGTFTWPTFNQNTSGTAAGLSATLAIASGGTAATTAASAIENLLPAYAGNGSKGLRLNSGATALEWVADGGGTVTSVAATVPSFLSISGSPITTSGTLAFSLSGTALPTTSGGTGLTSFTSGGVVYASSTSALATGSALTFDGTTLANTGNGSFGEVSGSALTLKRVTSGNNIDLNFYNPISTAGVVTRIRTDGDGVTNAWGALSFQTTQTPDTLVERYRIKADGTSIWSPSGTEALRLTSTSLYTASGINVGIGLSNPTIGLTVEKNNGSGYIAAFRSGTGNPYITFQTTGSITQIQGINSAFTDVNNIAMQISGGSVGIGTNSPSSKLTVSGSGATLGQFISSGSASYIELDNSGGGGYIGTTGNNIVFLTSTGGTERARIDSSGNWLVGTTSLPALNRVKGFAAQSGSSGGIQIYQTANVSDWAVTSTSGSIVNFYSDTSSALTYAGSISVNGNVTTYGSVSDYRLKENVQPMQGALTKVLQLNPVTFAFKDSGQISQGFIAHELAEVVPDAVTGEKDAVDENGNPKYQGIDTSFLVATLTAAIQEQQAIIESLKARLDAANL